MESLNQGLSEEHSSPQVGEGDLRVLNSQLQEQATQLGKINRELIDREQLLRLCIETGRVGVWVWDATGSIHTLEWSRRLKEIFGLATDAAVTREIFLECVHPEDRERVDWAIMQSLAGVKEGFYDIEYRIIHPRDGSVHWVTAQGQAFFNAAGQSIRFIGAVVDISDRKQVEEFTARLNLDLANRIADRTKELEEINQSLEKEVRERKKAEEALRATEHITSGHLEALTDTLTNIAQETQPEKYLEHILKAMGRQLGAQSLAICRMGSSPEDVTVIAIYEKGAFRLADAADRQAHKASIDQLPAHPTWSEFVNGAGCILCRLEGGRVFIRLAEGINLEWSLWRDTSSNLSQYVGKLSNMGVAFAMWVPTLVGGKITGLVSLRFSEEPKFSRQELELARALGNQTMLALQLLRMAGESRQAAIVAERNRMARDIHDTLAQGFSGIIAQLEAAKGASHLAGAGAHIERAEALARSSLGEARNSVKALRPRSLQEADLTMALGSMLKSVARDSGLRTEFVLQGERRSIPPEWEAELLRIVQESLTNTSKHAGAQKFSVVLKFTPQELELRISDDGRGFNPDDDHEGFGLLGMKERVAQMGGEFSIRSGPGIGMESIISLHCPAMPITTKI